jgi:tRNA (guanine10-N2)-methyltransferase
VPLFCVRLCSVVLCSDLRDIFHAIICDPPYGVRAGGRKSGGKKLLSGKAEPYVLTEQQKDGHVPSTAPYTLAECLHDLLDLAARTLVLGGRLVFFVPCSVPDYDPKQLPTHPILELVANSEQLLTRKFGRRLLTFEKTGAYTEEMGRAAAETSREFRERHVELVEKSRNEEIRALLKDGKESANGESREDDEMPVSGDGSKRALRTYRDKWC